MVINRESKKIRIIPKPWGFSWRFTFFFFFFDSIWFVMLPFSVTRKRELPWVFLIHDSPQAYWIAKISAKHNPPANITAPRAPHRPILFIPAVWMFSVDSISGSLLGCSTQTIPDHWLHSAQGRDISFLAKRQLLGCGADCTVKKMGDKHIQKEPGGSSQNQSTRGSPCRRWVFFISLDLSPLQESSKPGI